MVTVSGDTKQGLSSQVETRWQTVLGSDGDELPRGFRALTRHRSVGRGVTTQEQPENAHQQGSLSRHGTRTTTGLRRGSMRGFRSGARPRDNPVFAV